MKAELKFEYDTDNPDQVREIELIQQARLYKLAFWDLDQHLRNKLKYEELDPVTDKALQDTRDKLWEVLREYNLSLDD